MVVNKEMSERAVAFEIIKQIIILLAVEKGGRQEMELRELADHGEFVVEQLHLFEEKLNAGKAQSIFEQVKETVEGILHNERGRVR